MYVYTNWYKDEKSSRVGVVVRVGVARARAVVTCAVMVALFNV